MLVGACAYERPSDVLPSDATPLDTTPLDAMCDDGDSDGDGVCNGADDWPCGSKPEDPGDQMSDSNADRQWSADAILIGTERRLVVEAGSMFPTKYRWGLTINCGGPPQCMAYLEIGYGDTRFGCVRGGAIMSSTPTNVVEDRIMGAPSTPGAYELRLNAARIDTCGTDGLWFGGDPGPESTIAHVCVQ